MVVGDLLDIPYRSLNLTSILPRLLLDPSRIYSLHECGGCNLQVAGCRLQVAGCRSNIDNFKEYQ